MMKAKISPLEADRCDLEGQSGNQGMGRTCWQRSVLKIVASVLLLPPWAHTKVCDGGIRVAVGQ